MKRSKQRGVILIVMLLWLAGMSLLAGCAWIGFAEEEGGMLKPPLPTLSWQNCSIPVLQGSYCWSEYGRGTCVDMVGPDDLVEANKLSPVQVPAGTLVLVEFPVTPKEGTLRAASLRTEELEELTISNDNQIQLPDEEGVHVIDFSANWEQGSANFVMYVEIVKP
ncbi:hypothetical protein NDK47_08300 [Brevibacillus ruminantium]|uniref:Lipoprotein n=1 Tax=Brevibacillus ruminantium TaxID=2950604 RepID=A0ABY4WJF0_9BACL|nr:hypothetical protein [Brevibacillus ruminantium]USG67260.1 hypothetical protein NDK47_08300 [Brevibacillus ruminantium]